MKKLLTLAIMIQVSVMLFSRSSVKQSESVYTQKPNDTEAVFFTTDEFNIRAASSPDNPVKRRGTRSYLG